MYEKYSVLMSVYYKENPQYLEESIESMLNQTIKPNQIVMVKDGPLTNELLEVLTRYEVKFPELFECITLDENKGLGTALNIGIEKCRNDLVARMDTDDIAKPHRCETQLKEFKRDQELGLVGATIEEFIDTIDNVVAIRKLPEEYTQILKFSAKRNPFNHPVVMFKKSVIQESGGYLPLPLFEDYYLWARVLSRGVKAKNIQESLLYMRTTMDLYMRRGGIKYLKNSCILRSKLYKLGLATKSNVIIGSLVHGTVCLLPNKVRKMIYLNVIRKG